jgi:hypothetical protein
VNPFDLDPMLREMLRQPIGPVLGPREHERIANLSACSSAVSNAGLSCATG